MKQFIEDNEPIEIPFLDCGQYLIDYLMEVGPVMQGGMGSVQITHKEIRSWRKEIGIRLTPWEIRVLRRLSMEYIAQSQKSTKQGCPPPYGPAAHRATVANKIDAVFG